MNGGCVCSAGNSGCPALADWAKFKNRKFDSGEETESIKRESHDEAGGGLALFDKIWIFCFVALLVKQLRAKQRPYTAIQPSAVEVSV